MRESKWWWNQPLGRIVCDEKSKMASAMTSSLPQSYDLTVSDIEKINSAVVKMLFQLFVWRMFLMSWCSRTVHYLLLLFIGWRETACDDVHANYHFFHDQTTDFCWFFLSSSAVHHRRPEMKIEWKSLKKGSTCWTGMRLIVRSHSLHSTHVRAAFVCTLAVLLLLKANFHPLFFFVRALFIT